MAEGLEGLAELESIVLALLEQLTPAQRASATNGFARDIRQFQQRRIARQQAPDGSAWAPRKAKKPTPVRPVRFIYQNGAGQTREVRMRSWVAQGGQGGGQMTGYDQEAEGIRTFRRDRIRARLSPTPVSSEDQPVRRPRARAAMFARIRMNAHLRAGSSPGAAWAEFSSRATPIALIHHEGRRDRAAPGGPELDYPKRELLGWGGGDEETLLRRYIERLERLIAS